MQAKKKKILHIVEAFGGGVFTFLVDLINQTCAEYEIILACSIRPQTPQDYQSYFNYQVKIVQLQSAGREVSIRQDIKFYQEIKQLVSAYQPDIVHLHSSKAGFLGRLAINDKHIKVIYNPHGYSFLKEDEKWAKKQLYKQLEKVASLKCGDIVGVSQGEYEEALKLSKRSHHINNGINLKNLPVFTQRSETHQFKVCTIGRISYQKNPKLFNEVAKRFPQLQFTWIGDGELRDELTAPNIEVTGWLSKDDVLEKLNQADIFLLTSLWEGLPIALLEAMYYQKICIVTNVIGNRDVIKHEENGFVASDSKQFVEVMNQILQKKIDIKQIKEAAKQDIETKYNFDLVSQAYKQLYEA